MKESFSFKIEANPGKVSRLDAVLVEWIRIVNEKIVELWPIAKTKLKFPPKESSRGSTLICQAAKKAWAMCRSSRTLNGSRPFYSGKTIDLNAEQSNVNLSPVKTKFDGWADVSTLTRNRRVALPFRFYKHFNNQNLQRPLGGIRISRRSKGWYLTLVFNVSEASESSTKSIGIDVGYNIAAATSTGEMHGRELEPLQRRTKWRRYRKDSNKPYKQGVNRIAKKIVADHPQTDFAVEQLKFKGKKKRSAQFRTRLSRFAYQHLAHRLERLGQAKGFRVFFVNPAYTSQKCPLCGCVNKRNRSGDSFVCVQCGHQDHADTNGAININGGKAVVVYAGSVPPDPSAYPQQEYPGTMGALPRKQKSRELLEFL